MKHTIKHLLDAAFGVLAHDADELDHGTQMQRKSLEEKFSRILRSRVFHGEVASKAKPGTGLLQRRVGRSASDGQPEAVARLVGRKKAVLCPKCNDSGWIPDAGGDCLDGFPCSCAKGRAAGRCNRQRAIPANGPDQR